MKIESITWQPLKPLSEIPAGTAFAFVDELSSACDICLVLDVSHLTGALSHLAGSLSQSHLTIRVSSVKDLILYCYITDGSVTCLEKSEADKTMVYPVKPVVFGI